MAKKKTNKSVQREDPEWRKLEKIIADIQQALAPNAKVTHNDTIIGKSGTPRKVDVSIREEVGLNPILIDIDCKHRRRPVARGDVAKFVEQVEDIGPCIGIMISDFSFDSGAKYVAHDKNIILKTFREATETDWKQLFGSHPLLFYTRGEWQVHEAWMPQSRVGSLVSKTLTRIPPATDLFTQRGQFYPFAGGPPSGLGQLFSYCYGKLPRPRPIGRFKMRIHQLNPPFYIGIGNKHLISPPYVLIDGSMNHRRFPITSQAAKARSLKPNDSDKVEAMKVITAESTLGQIEKGREGVLLTREEWEEQERNNLGEFQLDDNHAYSLEFVATPSKLKS